MAETTYLATRQKFDFELLGERKLHGISKPVKVYRVRGKRGPDEKKLFLVGADIVIPGLRRQQTADGSRADAARIRPNTWPIEGVGYLNEGQLDQAEKSLLAALQKNPQLVPALNALGLVYVYRRDFAKAIDTINRLILVKPPVL